MLTLRPSSTVAAPKAPRARAVIETLQVAIENDTTGLIISARAHGKMTKLAPRGAVLTFQFYDENGAPLDVPNAGFTYSSGLERRFQYIPVGSNTVATTKTRPLFPPSGAAQVELFLQRWSGMDDIALLGELSVETIEYGLADLPILEATDPQSAERLAWRWLGIYSKERTYLQEIQAFAWRVGASALLREACVLLELAPQVRGYMRQQSALSLAALDELSSWLPLAPHQQVPSVRGLPHIVAHLVPNLTEPRLVGLTEKQYEHGLKPIVVVPTEYGVHAQPSAAYSQRECNGVELIELHPLALEARAQVKRTDLLRLDTLLTAQSMTRYRVGLLHAHVGRSGYDLALRALALGLQHRIPVVMQWYDPMGAFPVNDAMSPPLGSEWHQQAYAQQLRCAKRADAVLVGDAWQAVVLQRAGVHVDKIFIVPNPIPQQDEPESAAAPPRSQWVAHLDVTDLTPDQILAITAALPSAIKLPGLKIQLAGPQAVVAKLESTIIEARSLDESITEITSIEPHQSSQANADVVIRLRPVKRAGDAGWLSDLDTLLGEATLVLAERAPESECLVCEGRRGLTFELTDAVEFTSALADLAPNTDTAAKLHQQRAPLMRKRTEEAFCAALESAYRYALCSPG